MQVYSTNLSWQIFVRDNSGMHQRNQIALLLVTAGELMASWFLYMYKA